MLAAPDIARSWRRWALVTSFRAALVTPSGCWGYLCLHRAESPYGFTSAEVRLIGRLAASLGNGCRLSLAAPSNEGIAAIAPGVVVLHPDRTLAAITGEAEHLLAQIADHSSNSGRSSGRHLRCGCMLAEHRQWRGFAGCLLDRAGADHERRLATCSRDSSTRHGR